MNSKLLLYGSGGHAKVLIDCLLKHNIHVQGIFDDNFKENNFYNSEILGEYNKEKYTEIEIIIAIGNNEVRKKISTSIKHNLGKIIADSSQISNFTEIGKGTVILQNAVIQSGVSVGSNSIINTGTIIDHDSIIDHFVHIGLGAIISNNVQIGEGALIGSGSIITKNKIISPWSVIPPGSVI